MTPKEYKNKMMVKVVGSTRENSHTARTMIGQIFEVEHIDYSKSLFYIRKDKGTLFGFNLSDVQIATPVMYGKEIICLGDKVKWGTPYYEVYDYYFRDGEWKVLCGTFNQSYSIEDSQIEALDPLYKEVKEELAVGSEMKLETEGGRIIKVKVIE